MPLMYFQFYYLYFMKNIYFFTIYIRSCNFFNRFFMILILSHIFFNLVIVFQENVFTRCLLTDTFVKDYIASNNPIFSHLLLLMLPYLNHGGILKNVRLSYIQLKIILHRFFKLL